MDRHTRYAFLVVVGALLLVLQPPPCRYVASSPRKEPVFDSAPLDGGCEVVSFGELPSTDNDEFRYCKVMVVSEDGVPRELTLKAKKALVAESIKCSIKGLLW